MAFDLSEDCFSKIVCLHFFEINPPFMGALYIQRYFQGVLVSQQYQSVSRGCATNFENIILCKI
jgi:hypothetical protein